MQGVIRGDEEHGCKKGFVHAQCYILRNILGVNKTFLSNHLFNEDGQSTIKLPKGDKLNQTLLVHSLVFPYHLQLHFNG